MRILVTAILFQVVLSSCSGEFPSSSAQHQAAESAFELEQLKRGLIEIEEWHAIQGTGLAGSLRNSVHVSLIEEAFVDNECKPSDELKTLWSWRNGENSPSPFVWYHDFLSMEEALSEYNRLRRNPLVRWDANYIPVFGFEGEWYAAYCNPKGGAAGPVAHFFLEDEPRITHVNLTVFISTMAETLRSGAVSWVNGAMVEDINEVYRIHQKHNPGYDFPYHVPNGT